MTTATRTNPLSYLTDQLNELKAKGTHFKLRVLDDEQAPVCTFDGKKVISALNIDDLEPGKKHLFYFASSRNRVGNF